VLSRARDSYDRDAVRLGKIVGVATILLAVGLIVAAGVALA
jgi:hypothetical protein